MTAWNRSFPPLEECANFNTRSHDQLKAMLESSELNETADAEADLPDIVQKGLRASRAATAEMLEYYRRMGVKVTPAMTLADDQGELDVPRGVL